jgi:Na+-translocating ferredoxin:NAD+ oxidoreductase RnfG subunit
LALIFAFFAEALADVCVWRDPERTMTKLFPEAKDYLTIDKKISAEVRERIERRLGKPLDPGERENWIYYEIKGSNGETLGHILTDAEKGEYGAIEIVMGVTPNGKIIGLYIQRARERDKTFRSKEFLEQFTGKTKEDRIQIGKDIKAESTVATEQVAFGVRKMLVMFDELH